MLARRRSSLERWLNLLDPNLFRLLACLLSNFSRKDSGEAMRVRVAKDDRSLPLSRLSSLRTRSCKEEDSSFLALTRTFSPLFSLVSRPSRYVAESFFSSFPPAEFLVPKFFSSLPTAALRMSLKAALSVAAILLTFFTASLIGLVVMGTCSSLASLPSASA